MVVKFCPKCPGRPYTTDSSMLTCPVCGSSLQSEFVESDSLSFRAQLPANAFSNATKQDAFSPFGTATSEPFSSTPFAQNSAQNQQEEPLPFTQNAAQAHPETTFPFSPNAPQTGPKTALPFADEHNEVAPVTPSELSIPTKPKSESASDRKGLDADTVKGKVLQYSSTGNEDGKYRRLLIVKLIDALVYHQRFEDTLHRFSVRVEQPRDAFGANNSIDVPVNVHGTISQGIQLTDNCEVEVKGKYRKGVLMAKEIFMLNGGYRTQIKFQHSVTAIIYGVIAVLAAAFLLYFGISSGGSFFANIKRLLVTWLICFIVCIVLYLVFFFSRAGMLSRRYGGRKFPFFGIALFSLIPTLLIVNAFGSGTAVKGIFSSLLGSIIPLIVVIIILVIVFKLLLGIRR